MSDIRGRTKKQTESPKSPSKSVSSSSTSENAKLPQTSWSDLASDACVATLTAVLTNNVVKSPTRGTVVINSLTMKRFGWCPGIAVRIRAASDCSDRPVLPFVVCTLSAATKLPASEILVDKFVVDNCGIKPGDTVRLDEIGVSAPVSRALSCTVHVTNKALQQSPLALPIVREQFDGLFVTRSNTLAISFDARSCLGVIVDLEPIPLTSNELVFTADNATPDDKNVELVCQLDRSTHYTLVGVDTTPIPIAADTKTAPKPVVTDDVDDAEAIQRVGGLAAQKAQLAWLVSLPLRRRDDVARLGVRAPRGILLYGEPGTGKTLLARAAAAAAGAHWHAIGAATLVGGAPGDAERRLSAEIDRALVRAPVVIFVDEIDGVAPQRAGGALSESEQRLVVALLATFDRLRSHAAVLIGATNRRDALDDALRRPGRFDVEIELPAPDESARADMLRALLRRAPHTLDDAALRAIAADAHGFVGADLAALVRSAAGLALQRVLADERSTASTTGGRVVGDAVLKPVLTRADFDVAIRRVRPSSLRAVAVSVPNVRWSDVGGQSSIKQRLLEAIEWPLRHARAFASMGVREPRGLLLYGPPGCAKTMLAKAVASECRLNFLAVKGPELLSKWVGESERAVRELFRKARGAAPAVVFFDELDSLAGARGADAGGAADRVVSQLLVELDGVSTLRGVVVIAATNRPDLIDGALLRPGRIDRCLYVGPPDLEARAAILGIALARTPNTLAADYAVSMTAVAASAAPALATPSSPVSVESSALLRLAAMCEGFSGAEVAAVVRDACLIALRHDVDCTHITSNHIEAAIRSTTKQITPEMLKFYEDYNASRSS